MGILSTKDDVKIYSNQYIDSTTINYPNFKLIENDEELYRMIEGLSGVEGITLSSIYAEATALGDRAIQIDENVDHININRANVCWLYNNMSIGASQSGKVVVKTANIDSVYELPAISAVPGAHITIIKDNIIGDNFEVVIRANGVDGVEGGDNTFEIYSDDESNPYPVVSLHGDGITNQWMIVGGTGSWETRLQTDPLLETYQRPPIELSGFNSYFTELYDTPSTLGSIGQQTAVVSTGIDEFALEFVDAVDYSNIASKYTKTTNGLVNIWGTVLLPLGVSTAITFPGGVTLLGDYVVSTSSDTYDSIKVTKTSGTQCTLVSNGTVDINVDYMITGEEV